MSTDPDGGFLNLLEKYKNDTLVRSVVHGRRKNCDWLVNFVLIY